MYPFIEASSELAIQSAPLVRYIIHSPASECNQERRLIAEIFHALSSVIPRITQLICAETMAMSESIIIQAVYIGIGPFFVVDSTTDSKGREKKDNAVLQVLGQSAMRGLRLDALSLIRSVRTILLLWHIACSFFADLCQSRRPAELDYRGDLILAH
jgi:cohesin loading factor subunit SCC2